MKPVEKKPEVNEIVEKSADEIFEIQDRPYFRVDIPQWNTFVFCRELDVSEQVLLSGGVEANKEDGSIARKLILAGVFESDGKGGYRKKFTLAHYEQLLKRNQNVIIMLVKAINNGPNWQTLTKKN